MCGRFVTSSPPDRIAAFFGAPSIDAADTADGASFEPNFNVAPTTSVLGVVPGGRDDTAGASDELVARRYRWGLVPSWAKELKIGSSMINARAETITSKRAFTSSFAKRRILVPMDGFYEWQAVPGSKVKQPMFITPRDRELLVVAGLSAVWRDPSGAIAEPVWTCTLLTTAANATMAPVHDRMPVFLDRAQWATWLDPATPVEVLTAILRPASEDLLVMHPVSTAVNSVRNRGAELVEAISPSAAP
jgi:putative SOS response-associated peptidase YedK